MENFEQMSTDSQQGLTADALRLNYYNILDVDPGASRLEIREAYLRLKGTYSNGSTALYSLLSEDEARENMARVEEAFRILGDDVKRREFDDRLGVSRGRFGANDIASEERGIDPAVERINFIRSQSSAQQREPWKVDAAIGREVREPLMSQSTSMASSRSSSLPIIKTKATGVTSEDIQAQFRDLVAAGDGGDGDLYKRLREAAGVSENEMQDRTKVSIGYLKAIETNRFERLPQAVYVKGFLRSYFRYLTVPDAEKLVNAYAVRLEDWQKANRDS